MTRLHSVKFWHLPQNSSLARAGYEIVLCGGQNPFKEEQYELMNYVVYRAFQDTKNLVTTQQFFVEPFGNAVFRFAPLVDQFKRQVDQSIKVFLPKEFIYQKTNRRGITCNHFNT